MLTRKRTIPALTLFFFIFSGSVCHSEEKAATYGNVESYPLPPNGGGEAEFDYCYRYSKRIWELVKGQPRNAASLDKLTPLIKQALGSQGADEDIAEIRQYFSGAYKTRDEMAGSRFYRCGIRLRLPVEERHKKNAEVCFRTLNLPSYVADLRKSGRSSIQVQEALEAANPASAHPAIESTVKLIYSKSADSDVDTFLEDTFLACVIKLGEKDKTQ